MLTLKGKVLGVFESPKGITKSGEEYGGQHKVQLLGEVLLKNGETRNDLITLTCHDPKAFQSIEGATIQIPVGAMALKGAVHYFIPQGSDPLVLDESYAP